jgi:hypothetical protein
VAGGGSIRVAGGAAIAAGSLYFAGQGGELVFGSPSTAVDILFVVLGALGLFALAVAFWNLRALADTRLARIGMRLCLAAMVSLTLFAVQAVVAVARTGEVPDNFILFAIGIVLLFVGQPLLAIGARRRLAGQWQFLVLATVGLFLVVIDVGPIHDIGLFVFEGSWVAFGVSLLRRADMQTASTPRAVPGH